MTIITSTMIITTIITTIITILITVMSVTWVTTSDHLVDLYD